MASQPTERQQQIASFIYSESRMRGIAPTQREIADRFGFASLNSVRSHLRLMEKKGMLNRLPRKARGLEMKPSPTGIPLIGRITAGHFQVAFEERGEIVPVSPDFFHGSDLFALRVRGNSMKDDGILPGDIAVMNQQSDVSDGEIAAVLLEDEATLKHVFRTREAVILRGANPSFSDIVIQRNSRGAIQILGKFVGLIRNHRGLR